MKREGEKIKKDSKREQNPDMRALFEKIGREKFLYNEYENSSIKVNSLIKVFFFIIVFKLKEKFVFAYFIFRQIFHYLMKMV